MQGGLAIFVKTPGLSPLKTRLAVGIGSDSERWYRLAVDAVKSVALEAQTATGISAYWAVAENEGMQNSLWQSLPRLMQSDDSETGLGERMGRVMRMLIHQHGFGILLGADAPQICSADIQAAVDFLNHEKPRLVLGPASDGGFWCVGSNVKFPIELWQSVTYSQPDTYRNFISAFSPQAEVFTLRILSDVDEASDLALCHRELETLEHSTSEQKALLNTFAYTAISA
ncbi:MAG: DUF2064 domain-containing protein [Arenimonas sp.]